MLANKIFSSKNIFLLATFVFLVYLAYRIMVIFYPHPDAGGVEGNIIYFVQRILDGQAFYTDPEKAPYAVAQYSPLYYYIVAGVGKLFSINAEEVYSIYVTGRSISLLFNLALVTMVVVLCRKIFAIPLRRSLITGFLSFIFLETTSFARPDSVYHLFFIITLFFFLKSIKEKKEEEPILLIIITAVFAVVTLFSKQTGFILPLIIGLWYLLKNRFRQLSIFTTTYIITLLMCLATIHFTMGWSLFYKNAIQGINNGISFGWYMNVILLPVFTGFGLLFLSSFVIFIFLWLKENNEKAKALGFFTVPLFILLNIIALKVGSVPGYFTEWWILLFVLGAYYWPIINHATASIHNGVHVMIFAIVMFLKLCFIITPFYNKAKALASDNLLQHYNSEKYLAEKLKSYLLPGEQYVIFTNYNTPDSYFGNFLFRHAVMPQMEIVILSTYPRKKYDYTDFEQSLADGRIKWMLMKTTGLQKQFFKIKLDKFQLIESAAGFNLYEFKQ